MGGVEVSSVVSSIITALGNGLDIFHRLSGKKRKSNARLPRPSEEEEWLRQSLETRPRQIRNEYDQSVAKHGNRFEIGDEIAHNSLAHTLLVLNTGLVTLINHALSGGTRKNVVSRKTLYDLSETAALDTMTALGQLSSRLSIARQLISPSEAGKDRTGHRTGHRKKHKPSGLSTTSTTGRPPLSPLLVRGGWVRSKSGSSVVSAAAARKARGLQPQNHSRSQSELNLSRSKDGRIGKDDEKLNSSSTSPDEGKKRHERRTRDETKLQRQQSMLLISSDLLDQPHTALQQQQKQQRLSPRPSTIPLESDDNQRSRHGNGRPISTMTFMTASTKIGEIPESRFQNQIYSVEPKGGALPTVVHPTLEDIPPKKKKGFKFWKREDKARDAGLD
ncbi:hypothetical protein PV08_01860 [Exophiala spinifera]|uniref:Uncharacterized protein n=1 Tax=Exophiala spinifera TaxID=91928 RepID=A0A0D2BS66_9EURO|nr:uncharacterized protein PV08_01860 [Exophiala spinifera]KIW21280.1 hypothetical protein PV08_01860 [Exophiala spinifera]